MTKKIYQTTSSDRSERIKQRNRQAAATSRKKKELQLQSAIDKIKQLEDNLLLLKSKIFMISDVYKENTELKKQLATWKNMYYNK